MGWTHSKQRVVLFNGQRIFIVYSAGGATISYTSSVDNVTWETSADISGIFKAGSQDEFDIYVVNDTKFDLVYTDDLSGMNDITVRTCTMSGTTITCDSGDVVVGNTTRESVAITRTPSADRMYVATQDSGELEVWSADDTGDAAGVTGWTDDIGGAESQVDKAGGKVALTPYNDTDEVLVLYEKDPGGTGSDGLYSRVVAPGSAGTATGEIAATGGLVQMGNAVRVTDTDFRLAFRAADTASSSAIQEYKWNDVSWASVDTDIDTGESDHRDQSIAYDRNTDTLYYFSRDVTDDEVEYFTCSPANSCTWSAEDRWQ